VHARHLQGTPWRTPILTVSSSRGRSQYRSPPRGAAAREETCTIKGAAPRHNLQDTARSYVPLGDFVAITGSGSASHAHHGSLAGLISTPDSMGQDHDDGTRRHHRRATHRQGRRRRTNQPLIGRTPRSNPATYSGVFDKKGPQSSRDTQEAKVRGYQQGRFSSYVKGRDACETLRRHAPSNQMATSSPTSTSTVRLQPGATRQPRRRFEISYRRQVDRPTCLNMPSRGADLLSNAARHSCATSRLRRVGLGYVRLGQPAPTLSAARAPARQVWRRNWRVARPGTHALRAGRSRSDGTTFRRREASLEVLHRLVDQGNTSARDRTQPRRREDGRLGHRPGPRGGRRGGKIVAEGHARRDCDAAERDRSRR